MLVQVPECGCIIDDAVMDTTHVVVGDTASQGDRERKREGHWPIGSGPGSFCKTCDLYRPCICDEDAVA